MRRRLKRVASVLALLVAAFVGLGMSGQLGASPPCWSSSPHKVCPPSTTTTATVPTTTVPATTTAPQTTTTSLSTTTAATTTAQTTTPTTTTFSPDRFVYCLGAPGWTYGGSLDPGWWYDGTSTGWTRDAGDLTETLMSQRVAFDSATVMQTVSGSDGKPETVAPCNTIKTDVQGGDPLVPGVALGAQSSWLSLDPSNADNTFYGARPSLLPQQGQDFWYGFAFATNAGYVPNSDQVFGNWNALGLEFHSKDFGGLGPLALEVATLGPSAGTPGMNGSTSYKCGTGMTRLAQPRLEIVLTGGDVSQGTVDNTTNTCRRYQGPVFEPGHLYRVAYHVRWDAFNAGSLQVWVDGVQYVGDTGVSTLWRSGSTVDAHAYPQLQNYRYYTAGAATDDVFYGGVIRGSTQADVSVP